MNRVFRFLILSSFIISFVNSMSFASDWDLPGIDIISRGEWGADESWRLSTHEKYQAILASRATASQKLQELKSTNYSAYLKKVAESDKAKQKTAMANDYLKANYYDDVSVDSSTKSYNGQNLWWTQYYKKNKVKIIIHHTASDNTVLKTKDDVILYLQDVYQFHAHRRVWGDIGYNFIIDPFGNIYEGRAGGEGVIGAHSKRNNTPSIGISLIGNFENVQPSKEAVDALVKLTAVLVEKYGIDPFGTTDYHIDSKEPPYIVSSRNYTIAGHRDAGITACPGENLYNLLPYVRSGVDALIHGQTWESSEMIGLKSQIDYVGGDQVSTTPKSTKLTYEYMQSMQPKLESAVRAIKQNYISSHDIHPATVLSSKIAGKISLEQAQKYLDQDISVLLYDLTQNYDNYDIVCDGLCTFSFDDQMLTSPDATIKVGDEINLWLQGRSYTANFLTISSSDDIISISNYDRKSYAGVPRNTFHGKLIIQKGDMKDLNGHPKTAYLLINQLPFVDYMRGIVETNDTETLTKNEVMALISKSYALFYMDSANRHPNIPEDAIYNAVDHPDIFQKYVGAGLEKTLSKRYTALANTKDKIVMYQDYVPILPYFSCSAGFTFSANEKWGWQDTPYLSTRFDIGICKDKDFSGHGVGLSGLGAERWAKTFGRSYADILNYYYPGIEIDSI